MKTLPKPRRHFTKRQPDITQANTPVQSAPSTNSTLSIAPGMTPQAESQTQAANRLFRQRAEKISDVHVTSRPGENPWEPLYFVEIPDLWSEAFDKIVKLRGDLYRKYPESILNIQFRPLRELAEAANTSSLADV